MKPEQRLQRQCFDAFKKMWPRRLFIHIPNERKSKLEVIWLNAQGTLAGCPDVLIPEPMTQGEHQFPGLWIELKVKGGKLSNNQKTVIEALRERGHAVAVCFSLDEFISTVKSYFSGKFKNDERG